MRFLILILIFVNIGVWTFLNQSYFFQVNEPVPNTEVGREKLNLLSKHQIETLIKSQPPEAGEDESAEGNNSDSAKEQDKQAAVKVKPVATTKEVAKLCYRWGEFNNAQLKKAQSITQKLGLKTAVKKTTISKSDRYWVYMPPASSATAARNMTDSLRAQGITDLYVLNGPDLKNAISFGVFSVMSRADSLLKSLKAKGIQNVKKAPRNPTNTTTYRLTINQVTSSEHQQLKSKTSNFPKAKLRTTTCR